MPVKRITDIWFNRVHMKKQSGGIRVKPGVRRKGDFDMKYVCDVCGWIYDEAMGGEELGIEAGTKFEELPEDFLCPLCMVGKEQFSEIQ